MAGRYALPPSLDAEERALPVAPRHRGRRARHAGHMHMFATHDVAFSAAQFLARTRKARFRVSRGIGPQSLAVWTVQQADQ